MSKEPEINNQDMNQKSMKLAKEDCDCNTEVNYCCVQKIPGFITAGLTTDAPRLAWDPSCLNCIIEKCTAELPCPSGAQTVKLYAAKIVGCMPYQIETRYAAANICAVPTFTANQYSINCADCVRFNNAICFSADKEDLEELCKDINKKLREFPDKCSIIQQVGKAAALRTCTNTGGRFVEFTGKFVINVTCP